MKKLLVVFTLMFMVTFFFIGCGDSTEEDAPGQEVCSHAYDKANNCDIQESKDVWVASCVDRVGDASESELAIIMNCIDTSSGCDQLFACVDGGGNAGDDITINVIFTAGGAQRNSDGTPEFTNIPGYASFYTSEADAIASAKGGEDKAVYNADLNFGNGIVSWDTREFLMARKTITLPEGNYYVGGFVDFENDGCLSKGDKTNFTVTSTGHIPSIPTFSFESWKAAGDESESQSIKIEQVYNEDEPYCWDADSGDTGDTGDTADSGDTADTGNTGNTANTGDTADTSDTGANKGVASVTVDGKTIEMTSVEGWEEQGSDTYYGYWSAPGSTYSLTMYAYPSETEKIGTLHLKWDTGSYDNNESSHTFNADVSWGTSKGNGTFSGTLESPIDYSTIEVTGTFEADIP